MRRMNAFIAYTIVCVLLILSGCSEPAKPAETSSHTEIRLAIDLWPGYYPAIIANEKGLFEKHNINLALSLPNNTDRMLASFAAGKYDVIAVALGDVINLSQQYSDVKIVMVADESSGGDAILTASANQEIKGSTIGTNLGGFGELLVRRFLAANNVSVDDVNLMNIEASEVPMLLAKNSIDFAHTWQPYVNEATSNGAKVIYSSSDTPGLIPDVVAIQAQFLINKKQAAQGFVDAWFEAQSWWLANPEQGNALIAKATNQDASQISLSGIKLMNRDENRVAFLSMQETGLTNTVSIYNDFYIGQGILSKAIASEDILDSRLIK